MSQPPHTYSRPRPRSPSRRGASRTRSRRPPEPELKNVRIKVHHMDDTRFMMLTPDASFELFVQKVREKFALKSSFKLKTKDEGDLITMGDADDWEMAIGAAKREMIAELRRSDDDCGSGGSDSGLGKMEVWVHETP